MPLSIDRTRFRLPEGNFVPEAQPKDLVMLHFTAGRNAAGAFSSWVSLKKRIATAYLVDTDGAVYETFDPALWAWHLGIPGPGSENNRHEKRSIGIEIANVGPLKPAADPQQLNWWPSNFGNAWCRREESGRFVAASYRGFSFYAAYPQVQIQAVAALTAELCQRFLIPAQVAPEPKRAAFDLNYFRRFKGVAAHQNFRSDKFDVGPAFPWSELGLQTAQM